jgi:hypothetical protein
MQQRREEVAVPSAPVFYPTMEEFRDPLAFIAVIRPAAEAYGIAKVVPPPGAAARAALRARRARRMLTCSLRAGWHQAYADPLNGSVLDFETKQQHIHKLQEGQPFGEVRAATACCQVVPYVRADHAPRRARHVGRAPHDAFVQSAGGGVQGAGAPAARATAVVCARARGA